MAVMALKDNYIGEVADRVENFHGNQVVYFNWEKHLMFCSATAFPLPPDMPFGAVLEQILPTYYGMHPDFSKIDWAKVEWTVDGKAFTPDPAKSLKDHGIRHKSLIRFTTPGLTGIGGSCS
ncbi:MAG: phenol hydroxylase subunit P4 [Hyphomicrobiales bacterium]